MVEKETEVPGIETILSLVGQPPQQIEIPIKLQRKQARMVSEWNEVFLAVIPYCYKCKEPLVWHTYPRGKVLYHCPKCGRKWIKGEDWS